MLLVWGAYIWRGLFMEKLIFGILWYVGKSSSSLYYLSIFLAAQSQPSHNKSQLRSWRYCVAARLKFWRRSCVPKKGSRDEALEISHGFAAHDGSAVKSYSTILQRLHCQISLDYYTILPAMQATTNVKTIILMTGYFILLMETDFMLLT